jgi:hypothetical protein
LFRPRFMDRDLASASSACKRRWSRRGVEKKNVHVSHSCVHWLLHPSSFSTCIGQIEY